MLKEIVHEGPLFHYPALKGKFADETYYDQVITESARVVRDTGEHIFTLVRSAVPLELVASAWKAGLDRWHPLTDNRSSAAGSKRIHERKQDGTYSRTMRMPRRDQVASGVMGYYDRYPRIPYCRKCAYNDQNPEIWAACLPLFAAVGAVHHNYDPSSYYALQRHAAATHPDFVIPGTPYTTVTVNKNYRTAFHQDGRNMHEGESAMLFIRQGKLKGGMLVLPEVRMAVTMDTGDVIMFNGARLWHGNTHITPLTMGAQRCTMVFYFRKGMLECGSAADELERAKNRPSEVLR